MGYAALVDGVERPVSGYGRVRVTWGTPDDDGAVVTFPAPATLNEVRLLDGRAIVIIHSDGSGEIRTALTDPYPPP